jgi:hypothetical protein
MSTIKSSLTDHEGSMASFRVLHPPHVPLSYYAKQILTSEIPQVIKIKWEVITGSNVAHLL